MKLKSILLAASCATILSASSVYAAITVSLQFSPTLTSGSDNGGFDGSSWLFTTVINQPTYADFAGGPAVTTSTATLTISGSTVLANNGTFTISEDDMNDFVSSPNLSGTSVFLGDSAGLASDFAIRAGVDVTGFGFEGIASSTPSVGDPVLASDFTGSASFSTTFFNADGSTYSFPASTQLTAVPEPSTYAALAGALCIGLALWRRQRKA